MAIPKHKFSNYVVKGLGEKALEVTRKFHKGQFREGGAPYIKHPVDVARRYEEKYGRDEGWVACFLHDVLEDGPENTGISRKKIEDIIRKEFGQKVLDIVIAVSKRKDIEYGDALAEYKRKYNDLIPFKVKICDIESNSHDLKEVEENEAKERKLKYLNLIRRYKKEFEIVAGRNIKTIEGRLS